MAGNDSSRQPLKTLKAVPDAIYTNMLRLVFEEGGTVPEKLSGLYKSRKKAALAIKYYNEGIGRPKIYPKAPKNDIPQRRVEQNGEDKDIS